MSLVVKEWSQPTRPISKGGDVEKGGDVARRPQKVGTSFGTSKRWGRRPNVGTSFSFQKGGDVATDCGDVPTFFVFFMIAACITEAGRGGGGRRPAGRSSEISSGPARPGCLAGQGHGTQLYYC